MNPDFTFSAHKLPLAYLHQGKYSLAEALAEAEYKKSKGTERAEVAGVLGDIEAGRGRLDQAAVRYEEAARIDATENPTRSLVSLIKAAQIYFEQGQPEQALAVARRNPGPASRCVSSLAYLLLNNKPAAEKEFAACRASLTPLVGDYSASDAIAVNHLLAPG